MIVVARGDDRLADRAARIAAPSSATRSTAGAIPFLGRHPGDDRALGRGRRRACCGGRSSRCVALGRSRSSSWRCPALSLHTKLPNFTDLPHDLKIVRTYERIQAAFPGSQTPAELVVKAPNVTTPQMQQALRAVPRAGACDRRALRAVPRLRQPGQDRRADRLLDRRQRRRRGVRARAPHAPQRRDPADRRRRSRTRSARSPASPPARTTSTTR